MLFSIVAAPSYILTNSVQGFPFLHILTNTCNYLSFCDGHSDRWEVNVSLWDLFFPHCSFDLHFPYEVMLTTFSYTCWLSARLL